MLFILLITQCSPQIRKYLRMAPVGHPLSIPAPCVCAQGVRSNAKMLCVTGWTVKGPTPHQGSAAKCAQVRWGKDIDIDEQG